MISAARIIFTLIFSLSLLISSSESKAAPAHTSPNETDVFALMPYFLFDFKRKVFVNTKRGKTYALSECHTEESFCFASAEFEFQFPRNCTQRRVFLNEDAVVRRTHLGTRDYRLIAKASHPSYGLLVGQNGIAALIYSPIKPVSDATIKGRILAALEGEEVSFTVGETVSAVPFFACEKR